jgi:hypothetical protein
VLHGYLTDKWQMTIVDKNGTMGCWLLHTDQVMRPGGTVPRGVHKGCMRGGAEEKDLRGCNAALVKVFT